MSGADSDDVETLRIAREEARLALDDQLSALDDIDSKAVSVFRLNVALVGLLLSALSFAAASDVAAAAALVNPAVGAGVAAFALSATAAGLTYTTSGYRVGVGPVGLERAKDLSERAYLRWLLVSYADWLRRNERTNARKGLLVTLSVLGTVAGALALGVGAAAAFTGRLLAPAGLALLVLVVAVRVAGLPGHLRRLLAGSDGDDDHVAPHSFDSPMAGQRTYKGCDSRE